MTNLYTTFFFLLGLILGSFYNVVGYRLPKHESIIKPRSHCPKCNHELSPLELIPVFSYLFLKGKCKNCQQKIPVFYPLIELLTGILFAFCYYKFSFSYNLYIGLILSSCFVIILVSDINYYIIPDSIIIITSSLIIITNLIFKSPKFILLSILSGILMFGIMYLIMKLGNYIFKKETLGGGDIKLMFIAGLILHPVVGVFNIFLSSLLALPISIYIYYKKKTNVIPFGPFLFLGLLILFFCQINYQNLIHFIF